MDSGSSQFTTFILRVDIQTPGWENTMIKVLDRIPGATFSIDPNGIARVSGNIDPGTVLKLLAKAGKHAQVYCIDSGLRNQTSERRDDGHPFMDDPHGRYWQANHAQVYCLDSGLRNQTSERRDDGHHFMDDPHGRYWQANHQYYHHPYDPSPPPPRYHLQPPMSPPPQYLLQPPMAPLQQAFAGEPDQCTIM